jgi:electron transport complex protein RnfE
MSEPLSREFTKGLWRENGLFVMALGLCPALAVTTGVKNGFVMGLCVTFVVTGSNIVVSLVRNFAPKEIRIPIYIVVIASFVTLTEIGLKGLSYPLYQQFGIFISLIVVNCVILARAESFASKNGLLRSTLDGLGCGIGFGFALVVVSFFREFFGAGQIWGYDVAKGLKPIGLFVLAPGAFLVVGLILGWINWRKLKKGEVL